MVREDILGGLKIALSKGQSLESAMQSFYNAGYEKEEIEDAARALYSMMRSQPAVPLVQPPALGKTPSSQSQDKNPQTAQNQTPAQLQTIQKPIQPQPLRALPPPMVSQQEHQPSFVRQSEVVFSSQPKLTQESLQSQQIVSRYEPPKKKVDFVTIILVIILLVLLGILASVFFLKPQIVEFLNKFLE